MQSAPITRSYDNPFQRIVSIQTHAGDSNQAMRAETGKRVGGLTDASQPDDADGAACEAVATQPQGLPRGPATAAGKREEWVRCPGLGQRRGPTVTSQSQHPQAGAVVHGIATALQV